MLRELGAEVREVRTPADLEGIDGLIMPGGESTTMSLGIEREGLPDPPPAPAGGGGPAPGPGGGRGTPVLGTCAGLIMLDRDHLGLMDTLAKRNAFGRQLHSFEADVDLPEVGTFHAVFIRAPWIPEHAPAGEILAEVDGHPVAARQGPMLVVSFHPELTGDSRLHEAFIRQVRAVAGAA